MLIPFKIRTKSEIVFTEQGAIETSVFLCKWHTGASILTNTMSALPITF